MGDFPKGEVLEGGAADGGGVGGEESRARARSILESKGLAVLGEGGRLGGVVVATILLAVVARLGGDPEVGGAGVVDDEELLGWGADVDLEKARSNEG